MPLRSDTKKAADKPRLPLSESSDEGTASTSYRTSTPVPARHPDLSKQLLRSPRQIRPIISSAVAPEGESDSSLELTIIPQPEEIVTVGRNEIVVPQVKMAEFNYMEFKDCIPNFSGDAGTFDHFRTCVDAFNAELTAAAKDLLLRKLVFKLSGDAGRVYADHTLTTWEELSSELEDRFQKTITYEEAQRDMSKLKQRHSEGVRDFAMRVEKARSMLKKTIREKFASAESRRDFDVHIEEMALRTFKNGLIESIRVVVRCLPNATLSEAIAAAVADERDAPLVIQSVPTRKCTYCYRNGHLEPDCLAKARARNGIAPQKVSEQTQKTEAKEIVCFKCNKNGHIATHCPQRINSNPFSRQPRPPQPESTAQRQVRIIDTSPTVPCEPFVWMPKN